MGKPLLRRADRQRRLASGAARTSIMTLSAIWPVLHGGLGNLAAYLAAHVLLCLLPAFFIAGAMAALIPKEIGHPLPRPQHRQDRVLPGRGGRRFAAGGVLLHHRPALRRHLQQRRGPRPGDHVPVLRAGRQHPRAGLHRAASSAPTSRSRASSSRSLFGIGIGLIMALLFRADDAANDTRHRRPVRGAGRCGMLGRPALLFLLAWVALLLAGTLKLGVLTGAHVQFDLPLAGADAWQELARPTGAPRRGQGARKASRCRAWC